MLYLGQKIYSRFQAWIYTRAQNHIYKYIEIRFVYTYINCYYLPINTLNVFINCHDK